MQNIWSENKKVNTLVNILLFLMATNFFHYGIVILPIICVILFVENKYKFAINNMMTFVILCLFGITFFAFSIKLGIYGVVGMFLPMAYYIGSNIKNTNEAKIKKIIYILTLGMGTHVILNLITDLLFRGFACFRRNSHLDVWTLDEYPTTQTSILYIFIIGIIYYVLVYEKNKNDRRIVMVTFALMMIYEIALGRRTPFIILAMMIFIPMAFDYCVLKNKNKIMKYIIAVSFTALLLLMLLFVVYYFNILGLSEFVYKIGIVKKVVLFGFETSRLSIFKQALKIAPMHLFGGKEISTILDWDIHDLWFDVYDYAGIVPFIILVIYSFCSAITFLKVYHNKNLSNSFKLLTSTLISAIVIQFFIEPIINGAAVFLVCSIIVLALIERLNVIDYN